MDFGTFIQIRNLRKTYVMGASKVHALDGLDLDRIERVRLVACGTAYHACLLGRMLLERWARLPAEAAIGSEFRYADPMIDDRTLVVLVSQSGETADPLMERRSLCSISSTRSPWSSTS